MDVQMFTLAFSWLAPDLAWRVMFAVGLLPALLVVYVRRNLQEPVHRTAAAQGAAGAGLLAGLAKIFRPGLLRTTGGSVSPGRSTRPGGRARLVRPRKRSCALGRAT